MAGISAFHGERGQHEVQMGTRAMVKEREKMFPLDNANADAFDGQEASRLRPLNGDDR